VADNSTLPATGDVIAADEISAVKYQRIKLIYGDDGINVGDVSATNPFPVSVNSANFIISTNNSSTTQLAAGATFTGIIEAVLYQPSISLLETSDQTMQVIVHQYIDAAGTFEVAPITINLLAGQTIDQSFTLNGNYYKVTAQNTSGSTTTTFNLNTAVGTIGAADYSGRTPVTAQYADLELNKYSVAGVIAINTVLMTIDCTRFASLLIQCLAMGTTGVVTAQWSSDLAFTAPITATLISESGATSTTFNAAVLRATNKLARYFRLILTTATTAGTTTINVHGSHVAIIPIVTTQPVSGTVSVTNMTTASSLADGASNPTIAYFGAYGMLHNGTTWDRAKSNFNTTTGDTGAKTVTVAGATQTNFNARGAAISINMGTVSGTTPTFTAQAQFSPDGGTTWVNIAGAVTASITATGVYTLIIYPGVTVAANASISYPLPRTWRLNYTIGGTTPSFTITNVQVAYIK
jgi:hypothetical protein